MKHNKIIMLCATLVVTLCSLTSVSAQVLRDETRVPEEQIPVAIRNAFQEEFDLENQKGAWYIYFEQKNVNSRKVATPLAYIYRGKKDGKRVEIKYDPAGTVTSMKGITKDGALSSAAKKSPN